MHDIAMAYPRLTHQGRRRRSRRRTASHRTEGWGNRMRRRNFVASASSSPAGLNKAAPGPRSGWRFLSGLRGSAARRTRGEPTGTGSAYASAGQRKAPQRYAAEGPCTVLLGPAR